MIARRDRREWAVLGLLALGWALLVAPAVHQRTHADGHQHRHGPQHHDAPAPGPLRHGAGSLEHQAAAFLAPEAAPAPSGIWLALANVETLRPGAPALAHRRGVEQSQAP